jgi:hypothetical protein
MIEIAVTIIAATCVACAATLIALLCASKRNDNES